MLLLYNYINICCYAFTKFMLILLVVQGWATSLLWFCPQCRDKLLGSVR